MDIASSGIPPRPSTSEVDVFGLTHPGRVRKSNADHFLIASFHRSLRVHHTSLGDNIGPQETESRGFLLLVADGVGSRHSESEGSGAALKAVSQHLLHASEICSKMALEKRETAIGELKRAVSEAHQLLQEDAERGGRGSSATTLTMYAAFWPMLFVVQVGDSRCYRQRDGRFERLTNDQTMAQMMIEAGALSREEAEGSHLKHVLWSAVGANEAVPEVQVLDLKATDRSLLCSDGLTKHVSDDELADWLSRDLSSEEMCRGLVDLALERGGTDNVTVVSGRVRKGRSHGLTPPS